MGPTLWPFKTVELEKIYGSWVENVFSAHSVEVPRVGVGHSALPPAPAVQMKHWDALPSSLLALLLEQH